MKLSNWMFVIALCVGLCSIAANSQPIEEDDVVKGDNSNENGNEHELREEDPKQGEEDIPDDSENEAEEAIPDENVEGNLEQGEEAVPEVGDNNGEESIPDENPDEGEEAIHDDGKNEEDENPEDGDEVVPEESENENEETVPDENEDKVPEEENGTDNDEEEDDASEEGEESNETPLCTDFGNIRNLILTETDNTVTAIWDAPNNTKDCTITYRLTYDNGASPVLTVTTSETFYEFSEVLIPCSEVSVTVTGVGLTDGATSAVSIRGATRTQGSPKLYNMTTSCNTIQMTWIGEPFEENNCEVTHFQLICHSEEHSFSVSEGVSDSRDRTFDVVLSVLLPDTAYACNGFIFVTLAGFSPASETLEFVSNLEVISDFAFTETNTSLIASWSPPVNSEDCGVDYEVIINNQDIGTRTVLTEDVSINLEIPLIACSTTTVTVTPIAKTGSRGASTSGTHSNDLKQLNPVQNLQILSETASWNAPSNLGRCIVSYSIGHTNNLGVAQVSTNATSYEIPVVPCSWNVIQVAAVFQDRLSPLQNATVTFSVELIGSVENVKITELNNTLTASWTIPPNDLGVCNVTYAVTQTTLGEVTTFQSSVTQQALAFVGCTENKVTITPVVENVYGTDVTEIYETQISSIDPVQNLTITSSGAQWTAPQNKGNCAISYLVEAEDNFEQQSSVTTETSYSFDWVPCSQLEVTVTPSSGVVTGPRATIVGIAPTVAFNAPVHLVSVPSFTGANMTFSADSQRDNLCTITQASVRCVNSDQVAAILLINIVDNPSRNFTLNVNNLLADNIYTCTALWILQSSPLGSAISEPVAFRTVPAEGSILVVSNITSTSFRMSWDEPYGSDFIDYYSISMSGLGPNYFVPSRCSIGGQSATGIGTIWQYYNYYRAVPDAKYEIEFATVYTFGLTVTQELKTINTLPGIPEAPVNLQASWRYGLGQNYNVSAALTWEHPCNVKGDLSHFNVTVVTLARFGDRTVEYEDVYQVPANDPIEDLSYGHILPDMNPFFTYVISVNTVGGQRGPPATLVVQPPPACTCAATLN